MIDATTGENEKGGRIKSLRRALRQERLAGMFESADDLATKVVSAVYGLLTVPSSPASASFREGRPAVDRVRSAPDIAYVFGAAGTPARLWRRAGTTWTRITTLPSIDLGQAWYDWYVAAPPDNPGRIYLGAIDAFRGDLSGSGWTWSNVTTQGANSIHPNQHCLTFSPGYSQII